MYSRKIQKKMRIFFIFLVSVFSNFSYSQNNEKENSVNTNVASPATNSNSTPFNYVSEPLEVTDSISSLKEKNKMINEEVKKGGVSSKKMSVSEEVRASPSAATSKSSTEVMSSSFSSLKFKSSNQLNQRSPSDEQQLQMDQAVTYFETYAPESFEFHFYKYLAGNYSVELAPHLFKAYELKPNNTDVQIQMSSYFIIKEDSVNTVLYLKKIKDVNRISDDMLSYSTDLLLSVPENGTLITHGFDDTYSCEYLQLIKNVRPDVELISLDFLQSNEYRISLEKKGFVLPKSKVIDVAYLDSFCLHNESKSISISLTTPKEYFQGMTNKLFVVGLVFEYHSSAFNNFYKNDYLWNEVLEKKLVYSSLNEKAKQISSNYLPMLLQLRSFYTQQKNFEHVKKIDEALDKVSVQCKKYDQVQKIKKSY